MQDLSRKYEEANQATPRYPAEQAKALSFTLLLCEEGVILLQEKIASLSSDEMKGEKLKKVKAVGGEISKQFEEVELALSDTSVFSQKDIITLLEAMDETLPRISQVMSSDTRFSLANKLTGHLGDAGSKGDKLIQSMLKVLFPTAE